MFRKYRVVFFLVVLIVVAFGLFWMFGRSRFYDQKYRVGVILAQTGKSDFIGKPERAVLEEMIKDYQAKDPHVAPRLELVFKDSAGDPNQALSIFDAFAEDSSYLAVIGPSTSGEALTLALAADKVGMPLLTLAASKQIVEVDVNGQTRARPWVFKFAQNDDLAAERLVSVMARNNQKSVALLYSNDGFGKSGANVFKQKVETTGNLKIDYETPFEAGLSEPAPIVSAIPSRVQAVMIWGTAPGPALLIKELKRVNSGAQIYLSHGNASDAFVKSAGPAAEGAIIVGSRVLTDRKYLNDKDPADVVILSYMNFWNEKRLPGSPSHFGGHARDALEALIKILEMVESPRRNDVRDGLERLSNFNGVTGTFTFGPDDHAGLGLSAFETYVIRNGAFLPLEKAQ
jgi:branched-chain amino acid transport system substrate-binding protein